MAGSIGARLRARVLLLAATVVVCMPAGARAYHDEIVFQAPPFETASTQLGAPRCAATADRSEATRSGFGALQVTIDGPCATPGAHLHAEFTTATPFQVENGRWYVVRIVYGVSEAWASSASPTMHDFMLSVIFRSADGYLDLDGVQQRDLRGRCFTNANDWCEPDDDMTYGEHEALFWGEARCADGAETCSLGAEARGLIWSQPYPLTDEPQEAGAQSTLTFNIESLLVSGDTRTGSSSIGGTVRDDAGKRLPGACVQLHQVDGTDESVRTVETDEDGYFSTVVDPGRYRARIGDCRTENARWVEEWYEDSPDAEHATLIEVPEHEDTYISVELQRNFAPDVSIDNLRVRPEMLRTDMGELPVSAGTQRTITVDVTNPSAVKWPARIRIEACPRSLIRCYMVDGDDVQLKAQSKKTFTFRWDATGTIGDFEIRAYVAPLHLPDPDAGNNVARADAYAVVGGTGFGIG